MPGSLQARRSYLAPKLNLMVAPSRYHREPCVMLCRHAKNVTKGYKVTIFRLLVTKGYSFGEFYRQESHNFDALCLDVHASDIAIRVPSHDQNAKRCTISALSFGHKHARRMTPSTIG